MRVERAGWKKYINDYVDIHYILQESNILYTVVTSKEILKGADQHSTVEK